MARGSVTPSEARGFTDEATGARVRQITDHPSIHHHPFFFVPAYDDAMARLIFVSHRAGRPEIFAEERASGRLVPADRARGHRRLFDLSPRMTGAMCISRRARGGYRVHTETQREEQLVDLGAIRMRERGTVADAMGTTALSFDDRYWALRFSDDSGANLAVIDTEKRRLRDHPPARRHRPSDVLPGRQRAALLRRPADRPRLGRQSRRGRQSAFVSA